MDASVAQSRPLTAIGLRLLAAFSLTTLSMLVKLVGEDGVHLLEIIFWRQAVTLLAMIAFILWAESSPVLPFIYTVI